MDYRLLLNIQLDADSITSLSESLVAYCKRKKNNHAVSLKDLLTMVPIKIKNIDDIYPRIKECSQVRRMWNTSELAMKLGVNRQTLYNWKKNGYLVYSPQKLIDLETTVELWECMIPYFSRI